MGDLGLIDTMIKDGLWDAFNGYHMGTTAENVATKFQITRQQQDEFAAASQQKAQRCAESRQVQGRDRARDHQGPQGRHRGGRRRIHPPRRLARGDGQAAACVLQGRHRHRRQRLRHQRRRRGAGGDVGRGGGAPRPQAAGPDRELRHRRRRPGGDGHRPDPGLAQGAAARRLVGLRPRSGRSQRGLRRPGLRGQQGSWAGIWPR